MNPLPGVSIVVIGRNEGDRLTRCLASVQAASRQLGNVELIYVDSGSTDDSLRVARAHGALTLMLRDGQPSAAAARNLGWQAASWPFVMFLDGDTILDPGFLPAALAEMRQEDVAVVWGHRRELQPMQSVYVRVLDLDWIYAAGDTAFCGGDALMRLDVLAAVGGFDATLIAGEEPELCSRIRAAGGLIRHVDLAMTLHDLAITTAKAWWQRAFRAGFAYAAVAARLAGRGDQLWQDELYRTRRDAVLVLLLALLPVPLLLVSPWPVLTLTALLTMPLLLVLRSAARARWKSPDLGTRLLYAVHSHLQKLPILLGQIAYARDAAAGRARAVIDYKKVQPR